VQPQEPVLPQVLRKQQEQQALAVPAAMSQAFPHSSARRSQQVQPQVPELQVPELQVLAQPQQDAQQGNSDASAQTRCADADSRLRGSQPHTE
jgi:hypothetical protein